MNLPQTRQACVLEVNSKEIIAVTNDGEFINLPLKGKRPGIGDIIPVEQNKPQLIKPLMAFLAAAAVFLLMFVPYLTSANAVMWVSMDVNPSLELGINDEMKIVDVEAINSDAKKILSKLDLKEIPLDQAIPLILTEMQNERYIAPEKDNVVMITFASEQGYETLEQKTAVKVEKVLNDIKTKKQVPLKDVYYSKAKMDERKAAHDKKISLGKYNLYKKAKAKGIDVQIEDLTKLPTAKVVKKAGGTMGEILSISAKASLSNNVYKSANVKENSNNPGYNKINKEAVLKKKSLQEIKKYNITTENKEEIKELIKNQRRLIKQEQKDAKKEIKEGLQPNKEKIDDRRQSTIQDKEKIKQEESIKNFVYEKQNSEIEADKDTKGSKVNKSKNGKLNGIEKEKNSNFKEEKEKPASKITK